MTLIENYKDSLQAIYDHVGFEEDWVVCPLDDCTDKYWSLSDESVTYAETKDAFEEDSGMFYEDQIYKQRFYDKWVYEGKDFTMIFCDPSVDGMKWFRLFDNKKKMF